MKPSLAALRRDKDIYFLKKTLFLAKKGAGRTSPNPLVGAVIVKNNKILSVGYHKRCGGPHAEVEAMKNLSPAALKGATLYVNLEPCAHYGKTPPCVAAIIKNKIKRVVISDIDPNPLTQGASIKKMRRVGIEVRVGLLRRQARQVNEIFYKNILQKRPFVAVKTAQSLDGKITTSGGYSKWITQEKSRIFGKKLRDNYDCVLVGINTVIKDNPGLQGKSKIPYRVVIDRRLRLPLHSSLLKKNPEKVILFTSSKNNKCVKIKKIPPGVDIVFIKEDNKILPVDKILRELFARGIMSVYVEGGAKTLGYFFDSKSADKIYFFLAPLIIGGESSLSSVAGKGAWGVKDVIRVKDIVYQSLGEDMLVFGYPEYKR
jgi:diaminohydroxyphosphoribosylaminopyrimidine deaminase / 5-amino-6-(5-phosphoribosylamino)uracil reductase